MNFISSLGNDICVPVVTGNLPPPLPCPCLNQPTQHQWLRSWWATVLHLGCPFDCVYPSCTGIKLLEEFYFSRSEVEKSMFYLNFSKGDCCVFDKSLGLVGGDFRCVLWNKKSLIGYSGSGQNLGDNRRTRGYCWVWELCRRTEVI